MIEKNLNRLTAIRLRMILLFAIVLGIILIGVGFYFVQSYLYTRAVTVSHVNEDAETSGNDVTTLERLKQRLADEQATIERTQKIVADSTFYEYQDQIITDLNSYAAQAGIEITSFTFATNSPANAAGGAASAAAPAATPDAAKVPAGLKSTTVSVSLTNPAKYDSLMRFVHSIEQNLTKMQLASLSMTKSDKPSEVSVNTLEIEVYIK